MEFIWFIDFANFNLIQIIEENAKGICIHENFIYTYHTEYLDDRDKRDNKDKDFNL